MVVMLCVCVVVVERPPRSTRTDRLFPYTTLFRAVVLRRVAVLLRTIDAKFWGVVAMGGSVVILFFLPWLDHSPVKSIRYRPTWHKYLYAIFIVNFLVLGYLGTQAPNPTFNLMSQIGTEIGRAHV